MSDDPLIVVVCGMNFEARIARGEGVGVAVGADLARLSAQIESAKVVAGLVSFGMAGALASDLDTGDWIVARTVTLPDGRTVGTDPAWSVALMRAVPQARYAPLLGSDTPLASPHAKARLYYERSLYAVDMESHVVAQLALRFSIPFVIARVVLDRADMPVPAAAVAGLQADGSTRVMPVLRALLREPKALPELLVLARQAGRARAALQRGREAFGSHFGFPQQCQD